MKLLSKDEINKAKQEEQRMAIDQGVALAKRVDTLRALTSDEERNMNEFRVSALEVLKKDISEFEEQRSTLSIEVSDLTERRKQLLAPLDTEWKRVNDKDAELVELEGVLNDRHSKLNIAEADLEVKRTAITADEERIAQMEEIVREKGDEASQVLLDAEKTLGDARNEEEQVNALTTEKNQALLEFEASLKQRERELDMREEKLEKDTQELINERNHIQSQQRQLKIAIEESTKS